MTEWFNSNGLLLYRQDAIVDDPYLQPLFNITPRGKCLGLQIEGSVPGGAHRMTKSSGINIASIKSTPNRQGSLEDE
ncbi:hypothetical protein J6590_006447 [Homalodisca vitripennis]|nr:hypothetical protein J6590_006447 [Homalodisca vitripennis]